MGKDRHGCVRTNGKGVVPSDLWGTKSQVEIQKVIDEVRRNAQAEMQSLQERVKEEMEVKLKEQSGSDQKRVVRWFQCCLDSVTKIFSRNSDSGFV